MVVPAARVVFTAEDLAEIAASAEQILATGVLTLGPYTRRFEEAFAPYAVANASTDVSIHEIADMERTLVGATRIEYVPARVAGYRSTPVSNSAAKQLLDWTPGTPLIEGVRRYLDWLPREAAWMPKAGLA